MLAVFLSLASGTVSAGSYTLPELCRILTKETSVAHATDSDLRDYPIFLSVNGGDPARVERLVAAAYHAEWRDDKGVLRLMRTKREPNNDFETFEFQFLQSSGLKAAWKDLPIRDFYRMAPGEIVRYGAKATKYVRSAPKKITTSDGEQAVMSIRRMGYGCFESGDGQFAFDQLSKSVQEFLGSDSNKIALVAEDIKAIQGLAKDPTQLQSSLKDLAKTDPTGQASAIPLTGVAKAIDKDVAVALCDFSLFSAISAASGAGTVRSILGGYCSSINWIVYDGALVGQLPVMESTTPTQAKRAVLGEYIQALGSGAVANISELGKFVEKQRPWSSDSWTDAMLLALSGIVLDEEFIGSYPYNIRLYSHLTSQDWELCESKEPFLASMLSMRAQQALLPLLLYARDRILTGRSDPATWPSLASRDLMIRAHLDGEEILIGWCQEIPNIATLENMASNYDWNKTHYGKEPLFRLGTRRRLKLEIWPAALGSSPESGESGAELERVRVETGFSEVKSDEKVKPVDWQHLPDRQRQRFQEILRRTREQQTPPTTTTPPH